MIVGIDASNLRAGGGITHLVHLLAAARPADHGITEIRVWGSRSTLERLPQRPWLAAVTQPALERSLPWRAAWQQRALPRLARGCDLLFSPGGTTPRGVHPVVTMSRNMLPFEWRELRRYGPSYIGLRLLLLRRLQADAFRRADGVIFLTRYAERAVLGTVALDGLHRVIPHGVDTAFLREPRPQRPLDSYSSASPFRLLYVSIVDVYKHQWRVAKAVAGLRRAGLPLEIRFVGPAYPPELERLRRVLREEDPEGAYLRYLGPLPHLRLPEAYADCDGVVFASSCENMPNILLEGMACGLPIACSDRGPMPEVLDEGGVFFDPDSTDSIARAIRTLTEDPALRARLAQRANTSARSFTWERCADATFSFFGAVRERSASRPGAAGSRGRS